MASPCPGAPQAERRCGAAAAEWKPFGSPALAMPPCSGTWGSARATISRTATSFSTSTPVRMPIASSMKTRSSITMLPVAPGERGVEMAHPDIERGEDIGEAETARVVEMRRHGNAADRRHDRLDDPAHAGRIGVADRIGDGELVGPGLGERDGNADDLGLRDIS